MLEVVYQDSDYVAINKPSGLLVHRSFLDKRETQFAMQMLWISSAACFSCAPFR